MGAGPAFCTNRLKGNVCLAPRTRIDISANVVSALCDDGAPALTHFTHGIGESLDAGERRLGASRMAGSRPVVCWTSAVTRSTMLSVRLMDPVMAGVAVCHSTEASSAVPRRRLPAAPALPGQPVQTLSHRPSGHLHILRDGFYPQQRLLHGHQYRLDLIEQVSDVRGSTARMMEPSDNTGLLAVPMAIKSTCVWLTTPLLVDVRLEFSFTIS